MARRYRSGLSLRTLLLAAEQRGVKTWQGETAELAEEPAGVASGTFKTGRYSSDLIGSLQPHYRKEVTDPKLIELQDEIAVARAYIREIMRSGESGKRWADVEMVFWEMDAAIKDGDSGSLRVAMERMHKIVCQGRQDWAHRDEIMKRFEGLRRLVVSEHKHRIDAGLAVTHEQLAATLAAYVAIVRRNVDATQLRAIGRELGDLIRDAERGSDELPETH